MAPLLTPHISTCSACMLRVIRHCNYARTETFEPVHSRMLKERRVRGLSWRTRVCDNFWASGPGEGYEALHHRR